MRTYIRIGLLAAAYFCQATATQGAAAPLSHVAVLTGDQVVQILDETVDWYRTLGAQQQTATQPSDLLILYANQQTADKVVGLAFEIARANAELLSSEASSADTSTEAASSARALSEQQKRLDAQRKAIEDEIAADRKLLAAGKTELAAKLSELQGELDMVNARKNLLDTMSQFVNESDTMRARASALKAHIDAIAVSIPSANLGGAASAPGAAGSSASQASTAPAPVLTSTTNSSSDRTGIWELGSNVLRLSKKISTIDSIDARTAALEQTFAKIRTRPLEQLKSYAAQSDALAVQADSANGAALKAVRDQMDTLAWLFKETSAILIPLSKEGVLLNQYRHNLSNWRDTTKRQYHDALATLGVRLLVLAAMLAVVFAGAEVWRRAVLRYAHEPRRRNQLLMVRKVTTWILVAVIIGLTFVTELSSFATFAGLLTAGLAVAMQSVLVSIVGYFFLIGKYGIRVGDRVQIGNVSGEVIDLGLVRMHLMELSSQGPLGATGRVVAFANSIVFQASGGLFKQISGVNFAWHETTLTLPADADYALLKEKLLVAVNDVVKQYHDEIVRQTREIQKTTSSNVAAVTTATPQVQLHFSPSSVEAVVRYPVPLQHAAEIDEQVSEAMLKAIRN
ncbi:MAG TPA: mechanosensitive ion channel domain-containing protein [Steroidobacteraceae bacterium]|nr:mechanosensitive ion channel domain-containing protein [Steroidobacteraceae bacterium]